MDSEFNPAVYMAVAVMHYSGGSPDRGLRTNNFAVMQTTAVACNWLNFDISCLLLRQNRYIS